MFDTCRDKVVNDHDVLPGLDGIRLHLKDVLSQTSKLPLAIPSGEVHPLNSRTTPYSFSYVARTVSPGSLPFLRTGTNAAPSLIAMMGPRRKPRASRPTTTSIFFVGDWPMVCDVNRCTKFVMRVSNPTGSRRRGKISRKTIPCSRKCKHALGIHHAKEHSFDIPSWASQGTVSRDSSSTRRQPWSWKGKALQL